MGSKVGLGGMSEDTVTMDDMSDGGSEDEPAEDHAKLECEYSSLLPSVLDMLFD